MSLRTLTLVACMVMLPVAAGCTVTGHSVADSGDLSSSSVQADDFPVPGATRVPTPAVPFAVAGLAGTDPAIASPSDCIPPRVDATGAVVWQVIVDGGASSYTSAVTHADESVAADVARAERCPQTFSGDAAAGTRITTTVLPAPPGPTGVDTAAIRRITGSGDDEHRVVTSSLTLIGQRDGVRVYAQYRNPGEDAIPADAAAGLDSLFTKALAAAFG
ncbi:hypothetical protein ABLE94_04095 [Gordonia sp. VNK1]|jgi:hypothetical protein|uniref:hypothetical protein n=1 Tax=Gordonia oleivorans TaxID=3156618 RepID=UPI0032B42165